MRKKEPYETATMLEKTTAIELEARRLNTTYAKLVHELQNDGQRECEIINAYIIAKQSKQEQKLRQCEGCVYNVHDSTDGRRRVCSFHQTERVRRKDPEGNCLEYTTKRERRRDAPTKFQRLLSGDWSGKTVPEIARELDTRESHVYQMLSDARRKNGVDIVFKRTCAGRKITDVQKRTEYPLTAKQAEYMKLYESGMSVTEIAAKKGIDKSAVSRTLKRARGEDSYE